MAVGPPLTGSSLPVSFFSAAVISEMKLASTLMAIVDVMEKDRVLWLLRSLMVCLRKGIRGVILVVGRARRVVRRSLEAIVAEVCLDAVKMESAVSRIL